MQKIRKIKAIRLKTEAKQKKWFVDFFSTTKKNDISVLSQYFFGGF
jgi:hypothetical protein